MRIEFVHCIPGACVLGKKNPAVSREFNGVSFNNSGVVRPLVLRGYKNGGLWKAMVDNSISRLFNGVHW